MIHSSEATNIIKAGIPWYFFLSWYPWSLENDIEMKVYAVTVIAFCLIIGIGGQSSGESSSSAESEENPGDGILTRFVKAFFPPLPPLPEDLKRFTTPKPAPAFPMKPFNPAKSEAANLLGLLGSVIDPNVGKLNPVTKKPTLVRVTVTVPPAREFFKPKLDNPLRKPSLPMPMPNFGPIFKRSVRQVNQLASLNPYKPPRPILPLYQPSNYAQQYNQTTPPYANYSPPNLYNQKPAYNQTYNQDYGYTTTPKPYYYYPTTTLKPRPAPPVEINVNLPTTTTTTTTTYKPYTIKYGYGNYGGYKPSYKPYYKPAYKPMYKPYGME